MDEPVATEPLPETFERLDILDEEPLLELACLGGAANLPDNPEPVDMDGLSPVV